jgi:hypothetical protein
MLTVGIEEARRALEGSEYDGDSSHLDDPTTEQQRSRDALY